MEEKQVPQSPLVKLADLKFKMSIAPGKRDTIAEEMLKIITAEDMYAYYKYIWEEFDLPNYDTVLEKKLLSSVEAKLKAVDDKIKEAEEAMGESEIGSLRQKRAEIYANAGDKEKAVSAFDSLDTKDATSAQKFDNCLTQCLISFAYGDLSMGRKCIEKAHSVLELGIDFERKNRLKVYEGLFCISVREFEKAALLLIDCLATFSAGELIDYTGFVRYVIVASLYALDRVSQKKKVLDASEVISVVHTLPVEGGCITALYDCSYREFFVHLAMLFHNMKEDRLLAPFANFLCRELRIKAYLQFLTAYQSVSLDLMGREFGLDPAYLDVELSRFISSGRLACKIDAVSGLVTTSWSDSTSTLYQGYLKQADNLIGRVQKLSRVIT